MGLLIGGRFQRRVEAGPGDLNNLIYEPACHRLFPAAIGARNPVGLAVGAPADAAGTPTRSCTPQYYVPSSPGVPVSAFSAAGAWQHGSEHSGGSPIPRRPAATIGSRPRPPHDSSPATSDITRGGSPTTPAPSVASGGRGRRARDRRCSKVGCSVAYVANAWVCATARSTATPSQPISVRRTRYAARDGPAKRFPGSSSMRRSRA